MFVTTYKCIRIGKNPCFVVEQQSQKLAAVLLALHMYRTRAVFKWSSLQS